MKMQPPKPQKMILNFDATLAKVSVAAVVMTTAPVNQRILPVNLVMVKTAVRVAKARVRVAKVAANLEKMKMQPPKPQKMNLNFDATLAKVSVAAVVMTTAPVNQRILPVSLVMVKTAVRVARARVRVAKVAANLEKIKMQPPKPQKMNLNFDATFAKVSVAAVVMTTAPVNQRILPVNLVMIAKIAGNVEVVVILMNLMNQKVPQFLVDSFEKKQNELSTQPRSLVTEPKNPALVMIANVDVRVARGAANHEKVKITRLKHLKRFLHFDELLNEIDANAERELTRQSLTEWLILPA